MKDYSDIINLEHPEPKNHLRMSMENRAAQFSPFSALSGYAEELKEARRNVDTEKELNEDKKELMEYRLLEIKLHLKEHPMVKITYFIEDNKKKGGFYKTITGIINNLDFNKKEIILEDKTKISIKKISEIEIL